MVKVVTLVAMAKLGVPGSAACHHLVEWVGRGGSDVLLWPQQSRMTYMLFSSLESNFNIVPLLCSPIHPHIHLHKQYRCKLYYVSKVSKENMKVQPRTQLFHTRWVRKLVFMSRILHPVSHASNMEPLNETMKSS